MNHSMTILTNNLGLLKPVFTVSQNRVICALSTTLILLQIIDHW